MRLVGGVETSPGQVRTENQDRPVLTAWVAGVADGMGGHRGGDTAARLAVAELALLDGPLTEDDLVAAVRSANERILDQADNPSLRGMGTTLVALTLVDGDVVIANVGDSRAYRFTDGQLEQLTEDHSLVEDLVRQGQLSADEARNHPQRNIVTRVLGIAGDLPVDVFRTAAHPGDRYLLCSDGLFNEVEEEQIAIELERRRDPAAAARELVRLANQAGARDNVTCVVVDLRQDDAAAPAAVPVDRSVRPSVRRSDPTPSPRPGASSRWRARGGIGVPWRLLPYVLAVLVIAGVAVGGTIWWGRSAYFVGAADGQVVIFQGRPGGVLWMDPTVVQTTEIAYDQLTGSSQQRLVDPPVGSLDQARQVLAGLTTAGVGRTAGAGVASAGPAAGSATTRLEEMGNSNGNDDGSTETTVSSTPGPFPTPTTVATSPAGGSQP